MNEDMTIGKASELLRIPLYTIIYMERVGKISRARRNSLGHRVYDQSEIESIRKQLMQK
ncbi:MAG: MerR family transcriptional regulator [Tissierellales bacterium]|nr:MerR family transcriptional regulator [Tissierellales bacterium]